MDKEFDVDLTEIEEEIEIEDFSPLLDEDLEKEKDDKKVEEEEKEDDEEVEDNEAPPTENEDDEEENDEDRKKFGQRAQKRIRNLIKARKDLEATLSEKDKKLKELEDKLEAERGNFTQTEDFAVKQYEDRIKAEVDTIEQQWGDAYEDGDKKKLFALQQRLAQVEVARRELEDWKRGRTPKQADKSGEGDKGNVERSSSTEQGQTNRGPSKKALAWHRNNQWFGHLSPITGQENSKYDEDLTYAAAEVHKELEEEGVELDSDSYYNELDKRVRELYPEKFRNTKKVTPMSKARPNQGTKRKITLTQDEIAQCKRMGVDPKVYALEKAKIAQRQG